MPAPALAPRGLAPRWRSAAASPTPGLLSLWLFIWLFICLFETDLLRSQPDLELAILRPLVLHVRIIGMYHKAHLLLGHYVCCSVVAVAVSLSVEQPGDQGLQSLQV